MEVLCTDMYVHDSFTKAFVQWCCTNVPCFTEHSIGTNYLRVLFVSNPVMLIVSVGE